jgi:hypothetical protein
MSLTDRRRFPRFPFHSRATLHIGAHVYRGTLVDISMGGALFSAELDLNDVTGRRCRISVFRGQSSEFLVVDGAIVHNRERLVGVEFVQLSATAILSLNQIIELNLAVPSLLDRDVGALLR